MAGIVLWKAPVSFLGSSSKNSTSSIALILNSTDADIASGESLLTESLVANISSLINTLVSIAISESNTSTIWKTPRTRDYLPEKASSALTALASILSAIPNISPAKSTLSDKYLSSTAKTHSTNKVPTEKSTYPAITLEVTNATGPILSPVTTTRNSSYKLEIGPSKMKTSSIRSEDIFEHADITTTRTSHENTSKSFASTTKIPEVNTTTSTSLRATVTSKPIESKTRNYFKPCKRATLSSVKTITTRKIVASSRPSAGVSFSKRAASSSGTGTSQGEKTTNISATSTANSVPLQGMTRTTRVMSTTPSVNPNVNFTVPSTSYKNMTTTVDNITEIASSGSSPTPMDCIDTTKASKSTISIKNSVISTSSTTRSPVSFSSSKM
ncbi:hypothetical protein SK128_024241, partial [Halocaridina rubra]